MIATMEQDTAAGRRVGETSKNVEGSATGGGGEPINRRQIEKKRDAQCTRYVPCCYIDFLLL